jgi:predicted RNA-binding Zn-ribbon protein involved in translation (DUF1610 family)
MEPGTALEHDRRCPNCGALVTADADWCGQCFASLAEPPPMPVPIQTEAEVPEAERDGATLSTPAPASKAMWPCPACGNQNAIELDTCAVCGTAFSALMRTGDAPPHVEPKDALAWSLIFPGLGHRKVGLPLDGLARGVLFVLLFSLALVTGLGGVSSGLLLGVFATFLILALAVYVGSAFEAYYIAGGGHVIISARHLLWATVAVILLSVSLLAVSVVTVTKR